MRRAAVEAVGRIAAKGDAVAIAAVSARLEDVALQVRQAAGEAVGRLAEKGDVVLPRHSVLRREHGAFSFDAHAEQLAYFRRA